MSVPCVVTYRSLIIRFLPDINISTFLNGYFWLLGSFAGVGALGPVFKQIGGPLADKTLSLDVPEGWIADAKGQPVTKVRLCIGLLCTRVDTSSLMVATARPCLHREPRHGISQRGG